MHAIDGVSVQKQETIRPEKVLVTPKGETVVVLPQNIVGWPKFRVSGKKGDRVVLHGFELFDADGNCYFDNMREAENRIVYTLRGDGEEVFEPHFTYNGFQFIHVEEFPGTVTADAFEGIVLHAAAPEIGHFACSDPMLNQLQSNIRWSQKGNYFDVPTDDPNRDERLGWTGDVQLYCRTGAFNMDVRRYFRKYLLDLLADQRADGAVPIVCPWVDLVYDTNGVQFNNTTFTATGWGDAMTVIPYQLYMSYGSSEMLERLYDGMKKWVSYIESQAENGVYWNSGRHYADWVALDAKYGSYIGATDIPFLCTAYYLHSVKVVCKTAKILKRAEDVEKYNDLYDRILAFLREEYFTANGRLSVRTQTGHAIALAFGIVPPQHRKRVAADLRTLVGEKNWHMTTGFLGTPFLCPALGDNGHADAAYSVMMAPDFPSWLYPITKGATTIWEHMDAIKPDGTLWDPEMNALNLALYGVIGEYLYYNVAGIKYDEECPGYKHIIFAPCPGKMLSFAEGSLGTPYGTVSCRWEQDGKEMKISVQIPANTTAKLCLPCADGVPAGAEVDAEGMPYMDLGSGTYTVVYPIAQEKLAEILPKPERDPFYEHHLKL